jgi:hypothetical protein
MGSPGHTFSINKNLDSNFPSHRSTAIHNGERGKEGKMWLAGLHQKVQRSGWWHLRACGGIVGLTRAKMPSSTLLSLSLSIAVHPTCTDEGLPFAITVRCPHPCVLTDLDWTDLCHGYCTNLSTLPYARQDGTLLFLTKLTSMPPLSAGRAD